MIKFVLLMFIIASQQCAFSQLFERNYGIPVTAEGMTLPLANPWAGGLNSCQVSRIDVNLDGKKDIFIFDRIGAKISIYLNMDDTPGVIDYKYTLEFNNVFPSDMRNWVLLRDMNCDGKEDVCANSGSGFKIFWNISETELLFDLTVEPNVVASYDFDGVPFYSGIYSIAPDLPAFNDYDGDGDIDIWSWNEYSTSEYFYKNMSVENGSCDSPDFVCSNRCYGRFGESPESFTLFMGEDFSCDFNVVSPRSQEDAPMRHIGGTTLAIDLDQNGLRDLIIGDVTENTLAAIMIEESSTTEDSASVAHYDFPATFANTAPAVMATFLGAFYEDINNDGINDLLISPNSFGDAADRRSLFLYLNNGQNDLPLFQLVQDNFLQDGMIDVGVNAYPIVFDLDNDGLKDLFVVNRKNFELGNSNTTKIWYYHNTGTNMAPAFLLADENWLDIPSLLWTSIYPAFGDMDNDGDADLVIGDQEGFLHYFINDAPSGQACNFTLTPEVISDVLDADIDVGQNATPQIVDLNGDGKNDLVVGYLNGGISYYQNIGTPQSYSFQAIEDTIGNVVATSILGIQGKSVPHFFKNDDGLWELLIGTETGQVNHYNNIEGNIEGDFNLVTLNYENIYEGERCAVFLSDITGDNLVDLFIGNIGGGVGVYTHIPSDISEQFYASKISLYPNPAQDKVWVELPAELQLPVNLQILDYSGRVVQTRLLNSKKSSMEIADLSNGLYMIQLTSPTFTKNEKLVIRR